MGIGFTFMGNILGHLKSIGGTLSLLLAISSTGTSVYTAAIQYKFETHIYGNYESIDEPIRPCKYYILFVATTSVVEKP